MIDWEPDLPASPIREMRFGQGYFSGQVIYRADGEAAWAGDDDGGGDDRSAWKPSIHMARIATRILLEITAVRVEPLQDISEEQAKAEGIRLYTDHAELVTGGMLKGSKPTAPTRANLSGCSGHPSTVTGTPTHGSGSSNSKWQFPGS
jgi:hypothetical protein